MFRVSMDLIYIMERYSLLKLHWMGEKYILSIDKSELCFEQNKKMVYPSTNMGRLVLFWRLITGTLKFVFN